MKHNLAEKERAANVWWMVHQAECQHCRKYTGASKELAHLCNEGAIRIKAYWFLVNERIDKRNKSR